MSREILFRGKTVNGKWHYGNLAVIDKDINGEYAAKAGSYISNKCGSPFAYQVRPETSGQFTGKLDRNKKKMFGGDRVKIHQLVFDGNFDSDRESEATLVYDEEWMCWSIKDVTGDLAKGDEAIEGTFPIVYLYGLDEESFEITGNIHD